jgi:hypothetical protein
MDRRVVHRQRTAHPIERGSGDIGRTTGTRTGVPALHASERICHPRKSHVSGGIGPDAIAFSTHRLGPIRCRRFRSRPTLGIDAKSSPGSDLYDVDLSFRDRNRDDRGTTATRCRPRSRILHRDRRRRRLRRSVAERHSTGATGRHESGCTDHHYRWRRKALVGRAQGRLAARTCPPRRASRSRQGCRRLGYIADRPGSFTRTSAPPHGDRGAPQARSGRRSETRAVTSPHQSARLDVAPSSGGVVSVDWSALRIGNTVRHRGPPE